MPRLRRCPSFADFRGKVSEGRVFFKAQMPENALDPGLKIDHEGRLRLLGIRERIILGFLDLPQNAF
jgi:hypothetical protein